MAFAAGYHNHGKESPEEHHHEENVTKGPDGGHVIESTAGFPLEVNADKDANTLIADKALPTGTHVPKIVTIKTTPDCKAVTGRFEPHPHRTPNPAGRGGRAGVAACRQP